MKEGIGFRKTLVLIMAVQCLLINYSFGQYITSSDLENQLPSHELSIEGNTALFSTYEQPNTTLYVFDTDSLKFTAKRIYSDYVLAPVIKGREVYALRLYEDGPGNISLKLVILNTALQELDAHEVEGIELENYDVLATPFFRNDELIFSGNLTDSTGFVGSMILRFDTASHAFTYQVFDAYGLFESHGLIQHEDDLLIWGYAYDDSTSPGFTDLWVLRLDDSLNILDTTTLEPLRIESNTPYGTRYEHVGKSHEEFVSVSPDTIRITGTSRSFYFPSLYQETNVYLCNFSLSTGQYADIMSLGSMDSNSFAMFSKPVTCGENQMGLFSTYGSSDALWWTENADTYIKFRTFDEQHQVQSEHSYFKNDGLYQRVHSAVKSENGKVVMYANEYSDSTGFRTFVFVTDCEGSFTSISFPTEEKAQALFYPNPSHGKFNIEQEGVKKISAYNMQGALVKEAYSNAIDLRGYKPGIYLLRVFSNTSTYVQRVFLK